jgi:hypothetical protein
MNIFYLHQDPNIAAKAMTNKHVIKMILESAQLLSTAHHILDGENSPYKELLYRRTHANHPSAIWVRESSANYQWLYEHFTALGAEYTERYGKTHKSIRQLSNILKNIPHNIQCGKATPIKIAIANTTWHHRDPVTSYRNYYENEKLKTSEDLSRYKKYILGGN